MNQGMMNGMMAGQQAAGAPGANPMAPGANPMGAMMQNPQMMQQMMQMMGGMNQGGGMGGAGGYPGMMGNPGMGGMGGAAPDPAMARIQFATQLAQLNQMGFSNEEACLRALQQRGGSVDGAIDALLTSGDGNA